MKTIMFNDTPFGLTNAVLSGRKTQTRRIVPAAHLKAYEKFKTENPESKVRIADFLVKRGLARYAVGEVVAIAQSYQSLGLSPSIIQRAKDHEKKNISYVPIGEQAGWTNKMYVSADYMPHQILITGVRVERLQSIPEADVKAEGMIAVEEGKSYTTSPGTPEAEFKARTIRGAYAKLIDGVSKKRVYASNPWVYVFEFKLVK